MKENKDTNLTNRLHAVEQYNWNKIVLGALGVMAGSFVLYKIFSKSATHSPEIPNPMLGSMQYKGALGTGNRAMSIEPYNR